jgi:hypothetical protein
MAEFESAFANFRGAHKTIPTIEALVDTSLGNFDGRDVALARVQQNDAQNFLVEKLHIAAGSID